MKSTTKVERVDLCVFTVYSVLVERPTCRKHKIFHGIAKINDYHNLPLQLYPSELST